MSTLGLDIGTSGVKALIVSADGRVIGAGYQEYPLHHPRPGWAELDPEEVWEGTRQAIRQALSVAGPGDPVRALASSSQGEACVPLDSAGRILARAIVSFDPRSAPQAEELVGQLGSEAIFRTTGMPPHAMYTLCKMMWWKQNEPELFRRASQFLTFGEYTLFRLGVTNPAIDWTMAARTMALDLNSLDWSETILAAAGIDPAILPPVVASGTALGAISTEAADDLGLPRGVIAVAGGHDQPCGALGAGITRSGMALDATGTVECLTAVFDSPRMDTGMLEGSYPVYPHVLTDHWITIAFNFTGGVLLRWFRDQFGEPEVGSAKLQGRSPYELLIESAAEDAGEVYVLPHFTTAGNPTFDTGSAGAIVGLKLSTSRAEVLKAVLDGITYEIRLNVERLKSMGIPIQRLRAVGGGARSARWLQLKADIFGVPVATINIDEAPAFGAALLAGAGCGVFPSAAVAAEQFVRETAVYEPDTSSHARHSDRFSTYRRLYPALREFYRGAH